MTEALDRRNRDQTTDDPPSAARDEGEGEDEPLNGQDEPEEGSFDAFLAGLQGSLMDALTVFNAEEEEGAPAQPDRAPEAEGEERRMNWMRVHRFPVRSSCFSIFSFFFSMLDRSLLFCQSQPRVVPSTRESRPSTRPNAPPHTEPSGDNRSQPAGGNVPERTEESEGATSSTTGEHAARPGERTVIPLIMGSFLVVPDIGCVDAHRFFNV